MKLSGVYTTGWVLWILWFVVEEGVALATKSTPGTLSYHVWYWFSIKGHSEFWRLRRFLLLAFLAWLSAHFLTGGKF
jgi:hypothetical protein